MLKILFFPMVSYARPTLGKTLEKPLGQHSGNARFCSRLARGSLGNRSILLELARACSSLLDCCSIFARQRRSTDPTHKTLGKDARQTLGQTLEKRSKKTILTYQFASTRLGATLGTFATLGSRSKNARETRSGGMLERKKIEQKSSNNRARPSSKLEQARAKSSDFRASLERASSKIERLPERFPSVDRA